MTNTNYKIQTPEKLELRKKALELAVEVKRCSLDSNSKSILNMAYNFYDFLENDVEFSIKTFDQIKDEVE